MGFLEFDEADEWYEAEVMEATPSRPSSPPPRPTTPRPPTSGGSARPPAPAPRPAPTGGRPAPAPSGRPTSPTTRPTSPATRPAPSRPSTDWLGSLTRGLNTVTQYVPQAIDIGMRTADIVRQFQQPGGPAGPPPQPGGPPPAPGADAPFPVAPGTEPFGGYPPVAAEPEPMAPGPPAPSPLGMPSPYPMTAPPPAMAPPMGGGPPQGFDQLAMLFQALQQRQIPPLPSYGPSPYGGYPPPMYGQGDPMSMLSSIVGNPHFQQAMQWSAMGAGPRHVQLPLPAPGYPGHTRPVSIPMGAVMNTVSTLANQSRNQMNATTREDEAEVPEYLVDDQGGFIVDPAQPDDRSALVAHLFRLSDEAYRSGWFAAAEADGESGFDKEDAEIDCEAVGDAEGEDESEQWASEAGFTR